MNQAKIHDAARVPSIADRYFTLVGSPAAVAADDGVLDFYLYTTGSLDVMYPLKDLRDAYKKATPPSLLKKSLEQFVEHCIVANLRMYGEALLERVQYAFENEGVGDLSGLQSESYSQIMDFVKNAKGSRVPLTKDSIEALRATMAFSALAPPYGAPVDRHATKELIALLMKILSTDAASVESYFHYHLPAAQCSLYLMTATYGRSLAAVQQSAPGEGILDIKSQYAVSDAALAAMPLPTDSLAKLCSRSSTGGMSSAGAQYLQAVLGLNRA